MPRKQLCLKKEKKKENREMRGGDGYPPKLPPSTSAEGVGIPPHIGVDLLPYKGDHCAKVSGGTLQKG